MRFYITLIGIFLLFLLYKIFSVLTKKTVAYIRIYSLKKSSGASVKMRRNPLLSFFRPACRPDMTVRMGNKLYLIRFINGRSQRTTVHFATKGFYVSFVNRFILAGGVRFLLSGAGKMTGNATSSRRVAVLPEIRIPKEYDKEEGLCPIPVLIFSPAPREVTYVTKEKTSIRLAFTGDEFNGQMVFSASTFATYAEREYRHAKTAQTR